MELADVNEQVQGSKYEYLLFDLDDTLYPISLGLSAQVTENIKEYMACKLGIDSIRVPELCRSLYKIYGTTMAGLKAIGFQFDADDFHGFVHGRRPYHMLKPDRVLKNLLLSIPIRKFVFTNADKAHADNVLTRLGLKDCFEQIMCFETLNNTKNGNKRLNGIMSPVPDIESIDFVSPGVTLPPAQVVCKPFEEAFVRVFEITSINPRRTLFFDDSVQNLLTGKKMGLHTVRVGSSYRIDGVDYALESIHNIKEALPELWDPRAFSEEVAHPRKISLATQVIA